MTLNELIERLTELRDDYGVPGYAPINGAFQPNYPLVTTIEALTTIMKDDVASVYIALGDGDNYGTRSMWDNEFIEEDEDSDED